MLFIITRLSPEMELKPRVVLIILTILFGISYITCNVQPPTINPGLLTPNQQIGECQSCKIFIDSFKMGLERTKRGKYEGGDAAWEEEKLSKSYKRSEIRLVDIQEGICKEETKYSVQCHLMAEKAEELIEEWWAQDPDESADLYTYICIDKMQVCCPKHHYGKNCLPCPGDHDNICNGHGKCRGDGTRKGNGTCLCDPGYFGENCVQCAVGYYQEEQNGIDKCLKCHPYCLGGCRNGTQLDCVACKPGFIFDINNGCMDVNECDDLKKCEDNQFCLNTAGSYLCRDCDQACIGCYSDGPDACTKCAEGYYMKGELCISDKVNDQQEKIMTNSR